MLAAALAVWLAPLTVPPVGVSQDTGSVDAPVYESVAHGVSLPRPFDDWVFEPGQGRRTLSVIFHPKAVPLADQVWGVLMVAPYPGGTPLGTVADQRLQVAWRRQLGSSFALRGRDSVWVAGYPAIHLSLSGVIGAVGLQIEEYVIARRRDLVVLQLRTPRSVAHDSIAAGYRRVLNGLRLGERSVAPPESPAATSIVAGRLPWSPWQARDYDALVAYDTSPVRIDFTVRMDLVNDGPVPSDSVALWLWPGFELDSVRSGASRVEAVRAGDVVRMRLVSPVDPQETAPVTVVFHLDAERSRLPSVQVLLSSDQAYFAWDWLPRVQSSRDSSGQVAQSARPRLTLRFDVPDSWRAVAPGRMTAEVNALGRRRMTWVSDDITASIPAFTLGPYQEVERWASGLGVALWLARGEQLNIAEINGLVGAVRDGWSFCSRAFGRLPVAEINVVVTRIPETRGFAGLVMSSGTDSSRDRLIREVARTWWGNSVNAAGPGSWWILEGFPTWASVAARGALEGDTVRQRLVREAEASWRMAAVSGADAPLGALVEDADTLGLLRSKGVAALEAARRAAGESAFREAVMALSVEHRNRWISIEDVLGALGPDAQSVLRPFLY